VASRGTCDHFMLGHSLHSNRAGRTSKTTPRIGHSGWESA
jgi:hypothetical protein